MGPDWVQRHWVDARLGETRFTVNLTFVPKAAWELTREQIDWVGKRPSPNSSLGWPGVEVIRLGNLLPGGKDRWWRIDDPRTEAKVAADVVGTVRELGIPWLRSRIDRAREAAQLLSED